MASRCSPVARSGSMEEELRQHPTEDHLVNGASLSPLRQAVLVSILLIGLLFSSLDASIVSTSLVTISVEMKEFLMTPWVVLSYLLAYLGFAVFFAKLSDMYGRRQLLLISWVMFTAFSLGAGLARSMLQLIIFRALQGIGASGLYSLAQIGLFEVGPAHKPGLLGAMVGMTLAVSFVLGPILGGTISKLASWRWIFLINIPCGLVAIAGLIFVWPSPKPSRLTALEALTRIDLPGNLLLICATTFLVFALQEAGTFTYAWNDGPIVATLSLAALSWVAFLLWEVYLCFRTHTRIQPVFPVRLVVRRPYVATLVCTMFTGFIYLAVIIILPERFQIVNGDDSLMSGIHLLPTLGACAFGSFLAGAVSSKRNHTSITLIVASCFQIVGVGLLSTLSDITTGIQAQYGFQAIFGLGVGLSFGAATILTAVQSHKDDLAIAQGSIAQARVFGGAVGIAVCSIIFNGQVENDLGGVFSADDLNTLHHGPAIATWLPLDKQSLVRRVYASAFTEDIKIMIGIAAVALIASLFTFEANPPPMPSVAARKASTDSFPRGAQSDTEMDDLPRRC